MSTASRGLTPSVYESGDATEAILDVALASVPTCRLAEPLPLPESPSDSYGLRVVVGDTPPAAAAGSLYHWAAGACSGSASRLASHRERVASFSSIERRYESCEKEQLRL